MGNIWPILIISIFLNEPLFVHVAAHLIFTLQTSNQLRCEQLCRYYGGCRRAYFKNKRCTMSVNNTIEFGTFVDTTLNSNRICEGNVCEASQLCIPKLSYPMYSCVDTDSVRVNDTQVTTQSEASASTPNSSSDPASPTSVTTTFPLTSIHTSETASITSTSPSVSASTSPQTSTSDPTSISGSTSSLTSTTAPTSVTTSSQTSTPDSTSTSVSTSSLTSTPDSTSDGSRSTQTQSALQQYVYVVLKTWEEAKQACLDEGRNLAIIRTQDEWQVIVDTIDVVDKGQEMSGFWVSGRNDVVPSGDWVAWDHVTIPWTMWGDRQPDGNYNCLELNRGSGFMMDDSRCAAKKGYICQ